MKTFLGFYVSFGKLHDHHHFAKAGEQWTSPYKPSQSHPVKWQICRADRGYGPKPLIWIIWLYPDDGGAVWFEFGWTTRRRATA